MPASASFDAITQTVTWTPTQGRPARGPSSTSTITQPERDKTLTKSFAIDVDPKKPASARSPSRRAPMIETLLMIRAAEAARAGQQGLAARQAARGRRRTRSSSSSPRRQRASSSTAIRSPARSLFDQFLDRAWPQTNKNPRLDPKSPQFDKGGVRRSAARGRSSRSGRGSTRRGPSCASSTRRSTRPSRCSRCSGSARSSSTSPRCRGPTRSAIANNKMFLGMVAKHLLDERRGRTRRSSRTRPRTARPSSALMTDVMTFDGPRRTQAVPAHGFEIGIATEARMGGGSARNADGSYKSGDGWAGAR